MIKPNGGVTCHSAGLHYRSWRLNCGIVSLEHLFSSLEDHTLGQSQVRSSEFETQATGYPSLYHRVTYLSWPLSPWPYKSAPFDASGIHCRVLETWFL